MRYKTEYGIIIDRNKGNKVFSPSLSRIIPLIYPCRTMDATPLPPVAGSRGFLWNDCCFQTESDTVSSFPPRSRRKILLFQSRSNTLKGPVYLGARVCFPSLSSLTNTWLAVRRDAASNGDALNLLKSSDSGEKLATLALADSNCSVAVFLCNWWDWKQIPGTLREAP